MTNQDEIRRQLREAEAAQRRAVPALAEAADRIAQGDPRIAGGVRGRILGVPNRRQFLQIGGVSLLGAAVLAGCKKDKKPVSVAGGDTATFGTDSPAPDRLGQPTDQELLRTAASLEALAIQVYGQAGALLTTPAVKSAATLFSQHHTEHLAALNASIEGAPVTEPNQIVFDALVKPALDTATTEADALNIAIALETAAAETYSFAVDGLDDIDLRAQLATIEGVEARHRATLHMAQGRPVLELFPASFFRNVNPLPPGSVISS